MTAPPSGARKMAPMPGAHARRHRDAPVLRAQPEPGRQQRAEVGRDLRRRTLAPAGAATADGNGGGDQLHRRDARAELPSADGEWPRWPRPCRAPLLQGPGKRR